MEATDYNIRFVKSLVGRRCHVQFNGRQFNEQWRLVATRLTEGFTDAGFRMWELGFDAPWGRGIQWERLDAIKVITESSLPPVPYNAL